MNAVATSRATARGISTSISLFVRVIKMHYSSEVRKSSVLFVMGRQLVFCSQGLTFHLFTCIYDSIQFCAHLSVFLYSINQNTLSLFLRNTLVCSFIVTIIPQESLWTVLLIQPSHGFRQNLKTEKCLLMKSLPLLKAFPTNHLSVLITLKRWYFIDLTPDSHHALGETSFPHSSLKQYKPFSGLKQGMCLTHIQNCCGS